MLYVNNEAGKPDCNLQNGIKSAINYRIILAVAIDDLFHMWFLLGNSPFVFT